jgi:hypothetical protein
MDFQCETLSETGFGRLADACFPAVFERWTQTAIRGKSRGA